MTPTEILNSAGMQGPSCFSHAIRDLLAAPKKSNCTYGDDHILVGLVFFSTFEDLDLPGSGLMEANQVSNMYKPSPTPILYVGPVSNMLGRARVPLMPLFLRGNSAYTYHPTSAPSLPAQQTSTRLCRCSGRVREELGRAA